MFKTLLQKIIEANSPEEVSRVCGEIDNAYQREKISYKDHEMLYNLIRKYVDKVIGF